MISYIDWRGPCQTELEPLKGGQASNEPNQFNKSFRLDSSRCRLLVGNMSFCRIKHVCKDRNRFMLKEKGVVHTERGDFIFNRQELVIGFASFGKVSVQDLVTNQITS